MEKVSFRSIRFDVIISKSEVELMQNRYNYK